MKKILVLLLVCMVLTGCAAKVPQTEPPTTVPELSQVPEMLVTCGNDEFYVASTNHSWTAPGEDGEMFAVFANGHHPLERYMEKEFRTLTEDRVSLSFSVEPASITVVRWARDAGAKEMDRGESITLDSGSFVTETGSWIYQITVTWEGDTWGGQAEYELYLSR